ncbi:hypothetical protein OIN60_20065 [Paenibacillus sp. P96]|uniref:Terpene synthase n=1 Tax=Paenibacillus zeirhizosphaerae TaxID=2987519 RepID=A0ABT9FWE0_9BACL|nr:hypothetical protein [Paenibacillus sp. P96]MDP4099025.1 hypothetical protein [Paenibacillus sp. P96]
MEWYTRYRHELELVFAEAEKRISSFPAPLNTMGQEYAAQFNPLLEDSTRNYICYLLPFWVNEIADLQPDMIRRLSLGNVYIMLSFLLQDDVMDTGPDDWRSRLALAQLFLTESMDVYRALFPPDSPIWDYYRLYVNEWAASVAKEGRSDDFQENPSGISGKASPLKLAGTGVLLLSQQEHLLPAVTDMTDQALLILQMADDWADWREDLNEGSYNCLLSFIGAEHGVGYRQGVYAEEMIEEAVYSRNVLNRYAASAAELAYTLSERRPIIHGLASFAASVADELAEAAAYIARERQLLLSGGLQYLLDHGGGPSSS